MGLVFLPRFTIKINQISVNIPVPWIRHGNGMMNQKNAPDSYHSYLHQGKQKPQIISGEKDGFPGCNKQQQSAWVRWTTLGCCWTTRDSSITFHIIDIQYPPLYWDSLGVSPEGGQRWMFQEVRIKG